MATTAAAATLCHLPVNERFACIQRELAGIMAGENEGTLIHLRSNASPQSVDNYVVNADADDDKKRT